MPPKAPTPSRQSLERLPARALEFLLGVSRSSAIAEGMMARGYTAEEHATGWSLLQALSPFPPPLSSTVDEAARRMGDTLEVWAVKSIPLLSASLSRLHPEACDFLLEGLGAKKGTALLVDLAVLFERWDALGKAPSRRAKRAADRATLATLAARGFDRAERERVGALLDSVQRLPKARPPEPDERLEKQLALHAWLQDWSTTARAVATSKQQLIALGLAKRKAKVTQPKPPAGATSQRKMGALSETGLLASAEALPDDDEA